MKVSREKAQENLDRVIDNAARLLRERGFDGIGVIDLMKAAGLTHGGFYRSFASKDDLIAKATERATVTSRAAIDEGLASHPENAFRVLIESYVSNIHRDDPGAGCILPALGADAGRRDDPVLRKVFSDAIRAYIKLLEDLRVSMPPAIRKRDAAAILAEMVGAIVLARATDDKQMTENVIDAVVHDLAGPAAK